MCIRDSDLTFEAVKALDDPCLDVTLDLLWRIAEVLRAPITELLQDAEDDMPLDRRCFSTVSYTHLRAHETVLELLCRLLLEKKKRQHIKHQPYLSHATETNAIRGKLFARILITI